MASLFPDVSMTVLACDTLDCTLYFDTIYFYSVHLLLVELLYYNLKEMIMQVKSIRCFFFKWMY